MFLTLLISAFCLFGSCSNIPKKQPTNPAIRANSNSAADFDRKAKQRLLSSKKYEEDELKIDVQKSALQGEKVWVTLSGLKSNSVIQITFGDRAHTEPLSDEFGKLRTWHTYGCLNDADSSDYTIKAVDGVHTLTQSVKIICRITKTPTVTTVHTTTPPVLASATTTPKPTVTSRPMVSPTPTTSPTRRPTQQLRPSAKPTLKMKRPSISPTSKLPSSTPTIIVEKTQKAPLASTKHTTPCPDLHVVVSVELFGRIIKLPYLTGTGPDYPLYDAGTVPTAQHFEYQTNFKPVMTVYSQEYDPALGMKRFELKTATGDRDHVYLKGFYSSNEQVMTEIGSSPISKDTIVQPALVRGQLAFYGVRGDGVTCGIIFEQDFDPQIMADQPVEKLSKDGNNPKKYK